MAIVAYKLNFSWFYSFLYNASSTNNFTFSQTDMYNFFFSFHFISKLNYSPSIHYHLYHTCSTFTFYLWSSCHLFLVLLLLSIYDQVPTYSLFYFHFLFMIKLQPIPYIYNAIKLSQTNICFSNFRFYFKITKSNKSEY